jgi:hypothetical protein
MPPTSILTSDDIIHLSQEICPLRLENFAQDQGVTIKGTINCQNAIEVINCVLQQL